MKRLLALTILCIMLLSTLVACGIGKGDKTDETDTKAQTSDVIESNTESDSDGESEPERSDKDVLPQKGEIDLNGMKYTILSRKSTAYEFDDKIVGGSGGDRVIKAVHDRNALVADRYNVVIKTRPEDGDWSNKDSFTKIIEGENQSGWSEICLVATHSGYINQIAVNGNALDMNELDYVDYTSAWWSEAFYNDCLIDGKSLFMIGDIAYNMYERMEVMYFNQTLVTANNYAEDMYALVYDGKWTYGEMKRMALDFAPSVAAGDPTDYAILYNSHSVKAALTGMEFSFTYRDENDRHQLYTELPTYSVTLVDNFIDDLVLNNTIRWDRKTAADTEFGTKTFSEGKALFYGQYLAEAKKIKADMKDDFGILPTPKADEAQESYHTGGCDNMTGVMIPKCVRSTTAVGLITEALCMYSYQYIRPEYYEVALKTQYTDDTDVVDMLDYIRDCYTIPFGLAYATVMGNPYWAIEECFTSNGEASITSKYSGGYNTYKGNLDKMYQTLDKQ